MDTVDLGGADEPPERRRPTWALVAGVVAVVAVLVAGFVATARDDEADDRAEVESVEPSLAGTASVTRSERSGRVSFLTAQRDAVDEADVLTGAMTFGSGGRGSFTATPSTDEFIPLREVRALPEATYLLSGDRWVLFSNEDFTLDNGIRFPSGQNAFLGTIELLLDVLDHADPASVRTTGQANSHGDPVTVITAEVDLFDAFRDTVEVVDEIAAGSLFDDIESEITVWLDEQGRARFVRLQDDDETMEIELWDFGVPVDVDAPAEYVDDEDFFDDDTGAEDGDPIDGDAPDGRDFAVEVRDFCVAVEELRLPTSTIDPRERSKDWFVAQAQVQQLLTLGPAEIEPFTGRLVDIYGAVGAAIDDGATITELVQRGVRTREGQLDWRTLRSIEAAAFRAHEDVCYPV